MTSINAHQYGPWALVTGASSGIGLEFARQLAASGLNLILVARRLPLLLALGEELTARHGIETRSAQVDLSSPDFMDLLLPVTDGLEVGLLISNAGTGVPGRFLDVPERVHLDVLHLNAATYMRLAHYYGQAMAKRGRGGIILVGAMGATDGIPFMANAAATKAFVQSLGIGLHHELAEHGVRTTVVIPGPTETPVIDHFGIDRASLPMQPMSVEQCVDEGLQALRAGRATHLTGWVNRALLRLLPTALTRRLSARMLSAGLVDGKPRFGHLLSPAS